MELQIDFIGETRAWVWKYWLFSSYFCWTGSQLYFQSVLVELMFVSSRQQPNVQTCDIGKPLIPIKMLST